jgi:hypothetical protein
MLDTITVTIELEVPGEAVPEVRPRRVDVEFENERVVEVEVDGVVVLDSVTGTTDGELPVNIVPEVDLAVTLVELENG